MRRSAIIVVNVGTFTLSALFITLLTGKLIVLFVGIGLGPEVFVIMPFWLDDLTTPPLPRWWAESLVAAGFVAFLVIAARRAEGWWFRTALTPIPTVGLFAIVAKSYRLIGLGILVAALILYVRYARGRGQLAPVAYTCAALVLACLLPIDVTLQNVPGPPRMVPAVSGLFGRDMMRIIDRGDAVMVGGCSPRYNAPERLIVW